VRCGQLLLQAGIVFAQPGAFFLQLRVALHHSKQLFLQLGYVLGQPLRFGIMACIPQLRGAGRYRIATDRAREIPSFLPLECSVLVWSRGPPQRRTSTNLVLSWSHVIDNKSVLATIEFVVCNVRGNFSDCLSGP
jgi:hypothetical protein